MNLRSARLIAVFLVFLPAVAHATPTYNDARIAQAVDVIMTYLEGSFGATIMAIAGIMTIVMAAFGQYRAALSLLAVAIGAFCLRSFMSTFFNDSTITAAHQATIIEEQEPYRVRVLGDGILISVGAGAGVNAFDDGTIQSVERSNEGGYRIVIAHDHILVTEYDGLRDVLVRPAQIISRGERIGSISASLSGKKKMSGLFFSVHKTGSSSDIFDIFPDLVKGSRGEVINSDWLIRRILQIGGISANSNASAEVESGAEEF